MHNDTETTQSYCTKGTKTGGENYLSRAWGMDDYLWYWTIILSHLSNAALELAKKNGVHIITLPPHTSHKTQPLDRSVFGPMETYINSAANSLMLQNIGNNITIYNMASLMNEAWTRAATPGNIMSGFRASGIWPLNEHIFEDHEFLPSDVTDRLLNTEHSPLSTEATTSASNASTPATKASNTCLHFSSNY